ncbi:hypothetical protein N656DRAFT_692438, partial [Canariomyces notabilis]
AHLSRRSMPSPRYSLQPGEVELSRLDSSAPSILSEPPPYEEVPGFSSTFRPTVHLQIETTGKPLISLPLPLHTDPIPIFSLDHQEGSSSAAARHTPRFISIRPARCSGSSYLVSAEDQRTLSTTTYFFGPNRPPIVRLFHPASPPLSQSAVDALLFPGKRKGEEEDDHEEAAWDSFKVTSLGLLTRAVTFRSRLGTFEWRYASRRERQAVHGKEGDDDDDEISNMLVLERVVRIATAQSSHLTSSSSSSSRNWMKKQKSGNSEEVRTVVARFLRGPRYRTPGSSASSAGNGGRLMVDPSLWESENGGGGKGESEMAMVMIVTTCLVMLKKEVDRRRAQQMAVM